MPPVAQVENPRVLLTDDEVIVFGACDDAELEIRMLVGLVVRCEEGMRTRAFTAWGWTTTERERFASWIVPRTQTRKPERPAIPGVPLVLLRSWLPQPRRAPAKPE